MKAYFADILTRVLTNILALAFEKFLEWQRARDQKAESHEEIDLKLQRLKAAYAQAFDGSEVTVEQRENLRRAIVDFIKPTGPGL